MSILRYKVPNDYADPKWVAQLLLDNMRGRPTNPVVNTPTYFLLDDNDNFIVTENEDKLLVS
jgi:hypothetical protein